MLSPYELVVIVNNLNAELQQVQLTMMSYKKAIELLQQQVAELQEQDEKKIEEICQTTS